MSCKSSGSKIPAEFLLNSIFRRISAPTLSCRVLLLPLENSTSLIFRTRINNDRIMGEKMTYVCIEECDWLRLRKFCHHPSTRAILRVGLILKLSSKITLRLTIG